MKNIITFCIISLFFSSCKKEKVYSDNFTISGQFLPCSGFNNTDNYELVQKKTNWFSSPDINILSTFKTNNEGNFTTSFNTSNKNNKLILRQSSGFGFSEILEEIDVTDITNLKIGRSIYHLIINLNVTKPYTINDTLFIIGANLYTPIDFKIAGPFESGRLLKKINASFYPNPK